MNNALITGGAGFIGSHLAERLLSDGWRVAIIDNLSTGSLDNLSAVEGHSHLSFTEEGIENRALVEELARKSDVIFHLAAAVGVKLIVEDPVATIETNIRGTENVLDAAACAGGKQVVVASTSEVYGKGTETKFNEEDDLIFGATTRSRWSYGCSKAIDEFLALAYCKSRELPVIIPRLFNTVGPRQVGAYGMVLPRFVEQALKSHPITVYGDGNQVRCFTHVRDIVDSLCLLVQNKKANGEIFNVGSDSPVTIRKLAEMVREIVNPDVLIKNVPYEQAYGPGFEDIRIRVPDVAKLKRYTGFEPAIGLEDIIRDVKEYLSC